MWSARKLTIVVCISVFVGVLVAAFVVAALGGFENPEASGEKIGGALFPITAVSGVIAYVTRRSRLANRR